MEQALLVSPPLGGPVPSLSGSAAALFAGRYRVQHLLGRVGTAQLHQGWDELLERPVTVKVFDHAADTSGGDLWDDQPELQHLAGLSHPGLITVLDAGTEQPGTAAQRSFLVLERVRGTTLLRRLTRGPLPAELVAEIGQQLATTLAYLHQHGLVHGGVHPAAVLLSTPPSWHPRPLSVKLSDAGTAHVLQDTTISPDPVVTCPGPDRRPEQVVEADLGPAGDIFCLALLLLQALTGRRSAPGAGSADAGGPRAPIIPEDLDPGWAPLLAAMTHPDPTTRPPATEIADVLSTLAEAPPVVAESPPLTGLAAIGLRHHPRMRTPHRHPRRRWLPIAAAAAILLTGLGLSTSTPPTPTVTTTPTPPAATATAAPATNAAPAPLAAPAAPAPLATPAPAPPALTAVTPMQATTAPTPPPQATPSTPPPEQQATTPPPQTTNAPSPPEQISTPPATPAASLPVQTTAAPSRRTYTTSPASTPPRATRTTPLPEPTATPPTQAAPASPSRQVGTPPRATRTTPLPEPTATSPTPAAPAPPPGQAGTPPRNPAPPSGQVSTPPRNPVVSTAPSAAPRVPSPATAQQLPGAAVAPLPTLGISK